MIDIFRYLFKDRQIEREKEREREREIGGQWFTEREIGDMGLERERYWRDMSLERDYRLGVLRGIYIMGQDIRQIFRERKTKIANQGFRERERLWVWSFERHRLWVRGLQREREREPQGFRESERDHM